MPNKRAAGNHWKRKTGLDPPLAIYLDVSLLQAFVKWPTASGGIVHYCCEPGSDMRMWPYQQTAVRVGESWLAGNLERVEASEARQ